ncbi:MAG: hypothetical protein ABWX84_16030 [Nocardioides sp.]
MSDSPDTDEKTDDASTEDSGGVDTSSGTAGQDLSEEEIGEIEAEREKRLDPDNRPENAEVDNTDRDFDTTTGQFTDHEPDPDLGPFEDSE